ncbi:MAG: sugar porter family MFS transporter [Dysgonamonadaceae bacterium]|jgi:SP family arabinose:H+ symporter-like MFS transporter|nr:sugar porter family MFS transporter [Dysgonamonadaceae bacterium]
MKQSGYILLISLIAACGGLLFGFDTAVISGVLPFLQDHFNLDEWLSGWVVSILTVGCIFGVLVAGAIADKFGRKKVLFAGSLLFLLSAIGTALANNIVIFQIIRLSGGIAVGMVSVTSPMYIAEVSPPDKRGRMVAINQLTIVIGILVAFFSNYFLSSIGNDNWRYMLGVMSIPAMLFFILLFTVPESPRWLVRQGDKKTSLSILKKINNEQDASTILKEIENSLLQKREKKKVSFRKPKAAIALMTGIFLAIFQQITGINTIMYYAPTIFKSMGAGMDSALLQTVLIGSINLIFTVVSLFFIDTKGRKPLLLFGSFLMTIALGVLSFGVYAGVSQYLILTSILVYIAAFAVSLGTVTWVLIAELFPNASREMGMSISTMFLWIAAFGVTFLFPVLLKKCGVSLTFFIFMLICLAAFFFYLFAIKETKDIKLEDIE